jgi:hypothetical protein
VDENMFTDYRETVKHPICLSEIQKKLSTNFYMNEFEFANEVRLVFANCQVYNQVQTPLWLLAVEMTKSFDILFCDWVLNTTPVDNLKPSESEKKNAEVKLKKKHTHTHHIEKQTINTYSYAGCI